MMLELAGVREFTAVPVNEGTRSSVSLLERGVIRKEITDRHLNYDDVAFEYLWRITGGHPSLTQLICKEVWQNLKSKKPTSKEVSISIVRNAVHELLTNPHKTPVIEKYYEYLSEISIPLDMRKSLIKIIENTDNKKLTINVDELLKNNHLRKEDLKHLEHYNIISEKNKKFKLRIGFLKLWVDNKLRGEHEYT